MRSSGTEGREKRPAFDQLFKYAARGKLDLILAWSIDRLGHSLDLVVTFMAELNELGVGQYLHQQAADTSTAAGKAIVTMCGVFAVFEGSMIVERVIAGLARARPQDKTLGRPRIAPAIEKQVRRLRAEGMGIVSVARQVDVGVSAVQRITRAA